MAKQALFVYGTLHPDRAPSEIAMDVRRFIPVGRGTIRGELEQLRDYPAVRVAATERTRVEGTVFELPDDPGLLARLDNYEEFDPADPVGSLFVRRKIHVTLADGKRRTCWAYIYNRAQDAA